ncbi:hypothetical protein GcM3_209016 [Golovinomyces cichoracearum]|uniref:DUF4336 domain-containing protein n=1 Tax=Golovinomyces cichoracearum TaxID=62708 RepID=A0A420HAJ3_9PEZI|nr:hypothetical protein GcM3_209016 [Golovinomyces cichoracearum]
MNRWISGIAILKYFFCNFLVMTNVHATPSRSSDELVTRFSPEITTISGPFERYGKVKIGYRATIVEYSKGKLAVFSPCPLTSTVINEINGRNVRFLIAPDLEHHIFIQSWKQSFPEASLIGPKSLYDKRVSMHKKDKNILPLQWYALYTAANKQNMHIEENFDKVFDCEFIDGHINQEMVYLHKPSKTLIQADLIWNLPAKEQYSLVEHKSSNSQRYLSSIVSKMLNINGSAIGQRVISWYLFAKNRESFNLSIKRIQTWDFENIIPCHGDLISGNGKEIFNKLMKWHLQG